MNAVKKKAVPGQEPIDGFQSAIQALQQVDEPTRVRIISDILKKDPKMAARLREGLFDFADLQYLLPLDFKVLWWEVPRSLWTMALRQSNPALMKMLEGNLTKRAYLEVEEQIQALGPQPLSKVTEAQKEICTWVRKLSDEGRMAVPRKGESKMV